MIFIPGNVPSAKNSKVKTAIGVFNSAAVRKYLQALGVKKYSAKNGIECYKKRPNLFDTPELRAEFWNIGYPAIVGVHFVRRTRGRFDFHNMVQIIADLLVAHRIIPDDDTDHFLPVPMRVNGACVTHDKINPGVYLSVLKDYELPGWVCRGQEPITASDRKYICGEAGSP